MRNAKFTRFCRRARYLARLRAKGNLKKLRRNELFPAQRDDDFLLSSNKDHVAVFDSLDRDLMNGTADLQSELLTFAHYPAIDDGVTIFRIENNCRNDER